MTRFLSIPPPSRRRRRARQGLAVLAVAGILIGCGKDRVVTPEDTFKLRRGDLDILVTETGNLAAAESLSIMSRVQRTTKIVEIIPEGTVITMDDVAEGRPLVTMESEQIQDNLYDAETELATASANLTDAEEGMEIQKSDNATTIRAAEMAYRFAVDDLRKLVGEQVADLYAEDAPEDAEALLDHPDLGGQTLQDLRKYHGDIELEKAELSRAETKREWTEKLEERGYVTANELEADTLTARRRELTVETAVTNLQLYRRYEFPKSFQKAWAAVLTAREKLEREQAVARSRMSQASARLISRQTQLKRAQKRLDELKLDLENCTIRATQPGFVVYREQPRYRNTGPLREGNDVRPREILIELPDLSRMVVNVNVQEAQIDIITEGQTATLRLDAIPGRTFRGTVTKKGLLPNSQSSWLNPDLKVYEVRISIDEEDTALRPGMTATVEILAEHIPGVLFVPVQSVQTDEEGRHFCHLVSGSRREVALGKRNQIFVAIESGLEEGDVILMSPPELKVREQKQ